MVAVQEVQPECPRRAHCDNKNAGAIKCAVLHQANGAHSLSFAACLRNGKWATEQGRPITEARLRYLPVGEAVLYLIPLSVIGELYYPLLI